MSDNLPDMEVHIHTAPKGRLVLFFNMLHPWASTHYVCTLDRAEDAYKLASRLRDASDRVAELAKQLPGAKP